MKRSFSHLRLLVSREILDPQMRIRVGRRPRSWSFLWQAEPPRASLGQGASEIRVGGGGAPPVVLTPSGKSKATRRCLSVMAAAGGWGVGWRSSPWHSNGGGEARRKNSWSPTGNFPHHLPTHLLPPTSVLETCLLQLGARYCLTR
jgi:hypothetical protein